MMLSILSDTLATSLVFTLMHSLWQIALVALLIGMALQHSYYQDSFRRSQLCFWGLILIAVTSTFTFVYYYGSASGWISPELASSSSGAMAEGAGSSSIAIPYQLERAPDIIEWILLHPIQIAITWLCGVLLFAIRILLGVIGIRKIRNQLDYNSPTELKTRFESLKKSLRAPTRLKLALSRSVKMPIVLGHFRPVIVLPIAILNQLDLDEVETIIMHEIAHVLRFDFVQNLLVVLVETLFFFHPLVWWITHILKQEREHSCDDFTVQHVPQRLTYAKTLLKIESLSQGSQNPMALALYSNQYSLMKRIKRIMEKNHSNNFSNYRSSIIACFFLITVALVGASWVSKDDDGEKNIVKTKIEKLENKVNLLKKEIKLPNIGSIVHIDHDTSIRPEASEQEREKLRSELDEMRESLRQQRDQQREQLREIRDLHNSELDLQRERMRELKEKLGDRMDDKDYKAFRNNFKMSEEEAEEWAEKWAQEAEEWAERFEGQFDEEWIEKMENLGESIRENFDEEWAADMEKWGNEFAESFDENDFEFDEGWLEGIAEFSAEMAEMGAEIGSKVGMEVARALENADLDIDDLDYNIDFGDATNPDQLKAALATQMTQDGEVSNGKNMMVMTDRTLKINGELQSSDKYNHYKNIVQQYEDDAFSDNLRTKIKFHFYGKNYDDSERISLSVEIDD